MSRNSSSSNNGQSPIVYVDPLLIAVDQIPPNWNQERPAYARPPAFPAAPSYPTSPNIPIVTVDPVYISPAFTTSDPLTARTMVAGPITPLLTERTTLAETTVSPEPETSSKSWSWLWLVVAGWYLTRKKK